MMTVAQIVVRIRQKALIPPMNVLQLPMRARFAADNGADVLCQGACRCWDSLFSRSKFQC